MDVVKLLEIVVGFGGMALVFLHYNDLWIFRK
ncbi:hypothetical protein [Providencia phage PSTCR5]|uniref:Uncharacterized protein n=1 Tax=Providencia phage PSTCR5 TaxID=2783547 RepID=A0A873WNH5_9CAUD|nr:hypothetical protein KNV68_gp051 [Providencia phage PSTCR5]QPB12149.1 hypothetical protein [Providencia phage PSTCR5]